MSAYFEVSGNTYFYKYQYSYHFSFFNYHSSPCFPIAYSNGIRRRIRSRSQKNGLDNGFVSFAWDARGRDSGLKTTLAGRITAGGGSYLASAVCAGFFSTVLMSL